MLGQCLCQMTRGMNRIRGNRFLLWELRHLRQQDLRCPAALDGGEGSSLFCRMACQQAR